MNLVLLLSVLAATQKDQAKQDEQKWYRQHGRQRSEANPDDEHSVERQDKLNYCRDRENEAST